MQRCYLGGSSGTDHFGTMTIGLVHGETLLTIIHAFSKSSNCFCSQDACLMANYMVFAYGGIITSIYIHGD